MDLSAQGRARLGQTELLWKLVDLVAGQLWKWMPNSTKHSLVIKGLFLGRREGVSNLETESDDMMNLVKILKKEQV